MKNPEKNDTSTKKSIEGKINKADIEYLQKLLGEDNVIMDADVMKKYNTDFTKKYHGCS